MSEIRLDSELLAECVAGFRSEADNLAAIISVLSSWKDRLPEFWSGLACDSAIATIEALMPGFENSKLRIEDMALALEKSGEAFTTTDADVAGGLSI